MIGCNSYNSQTNIVSGGQCGHHDLACSVLISEIVRNMLYIDIFLFCQKGVVNHYFKESGSREVKGN